MDKGADQTSAGISSLVDDWSSDKQTFDMPWGKLMMWIFLLSDTFIFSVFLTAYMSVRMTTTPIGHPPARFLPWSSPASMYPYCSSPL